MMFVFVGNAVFLADTNPFIFILSFLSVFVTTWSGLRLFTLQLLADSASHLLHCPNCSSAHVLASVWHQQTLAAFTWSLLFTSNLAESSARIGKPCLNTSGTINWLLFKKEKIIQFESGGLNLFYKLFHITFLSWNITTCLLYLIQTCSPEEDVPLSSFIYSLYEFSTIFPNGASFPGEASLDSYVY